MREQRFPPLDDDRPDGMLQDDQDAYEQLLQGSNGLPPDPGEPVRGEARLQDGHLADCSVKWCGATHAYVLLTWSMWLG